MPLFPIAIRPLSQPGLVVKDPLMSGVNVSLNFQGSMCLGTDRPPTMPAELASTSGSADGPKHPNGEASGELAISNIVTCQFVTGCTPPLAQGDALHERVAILPF